MLRLFNLSVGSDVVELESLKATGAIQHTSDEYTAQLAELYAIEHPTEVFAPDIKDKIKSYIASFDSLEKEGRWAYFPWRSTLVHILGDESFQKVRTARNRYLITDEEQKKFYDSVIGIAGLSVGNSVALTIVLQGGSKRIKIADHDTLDLSNTNRIRTSITDLGVTKVEMTARQIYEINPYAEVEVYPDGLTDATMGKFFDGMTIMIDEIDNLAVKYTIREEAKKRKLPVLMAADNDKSGVIDIERYDQDPQPEFFHGRLAGLTKEDLAKLDKRGIGRTIAQLVGIENHTAPMLTSLQEMGKSIVSWPQLGGTALLNGSLLAYCALRVANGQSLIADRAIVDMNAILDSAFNSTEEVSKRDSAIANFKKILGL